LAPTSYANDICIFFPFTTLSNSIIRAAHYTNVWRILGVLAMVQPAFRRATKGESSPPATLIRTQSLESASPVPTATQKSKCVKAASSKRPRSRLRGSVGNVPSSASCQNISDVLICIGVRLRAQQNWYREYKNSDHYTKFCHERHSST